MAAIPVADVRRPARHHHPLANRFVLALLRSPAHHLLDPGLCELRFAGRRTRARIAVPVIYAMAGERTVVLVGDAPAKSWWRNFRNPAPVQLRRGGVVRDGVARVLRPDDAGYLDAARAYAARHGLLAQRTDRLVVVDAPARKAAR